MMSGGLALTLMGLLMVIGVKRKWRILLHPPDHVWIFTIWPYSLMKGPRYNERFFAVYHVIGGVVLCSVGLVFLLLSAA